MDALPLALIVIFCTPSGWVGLLCLALVILAMRVPLRRA